VPFTPGHELVGEVVDYPMGQKKWKKKSRRWS